MYCIYNHTGAEAKFKCQWWPSYTYWWSHNFPKQFSQCFTNLPVRKLLIISNPNVQSYNFSLFLLVLSPAQTTIYFYSPIAFYVLGVFYPPLLIFSLLYPGLKILSLSLYFWHVSNSIFGWDIVFPTLATAAQQATPQFFLFNCHSTASPFLVFP